MATKGVTIKWLKQNLFEKLPRSVISSYSALESTFDFITKLENTPTTLPVRSLQYEEVLQIFGLMEDNAMRWTLEQRDLYDPPTALTTMLREIDFVVRGSPKNEAYARCVLNNILVSCVAEEKKLAGSTKQTRSFTASRDGTLRPTTPTVDPVELSLRFETSLTCVVTYKRETRRLNGLADYTLWYDDAESMGTNLVVVEAKKHQFIGQAASQVVAYMAIVHTSRRQARKPNSVVYGICSDGLVFRFYRIDNESVLTQSRTFEWRFSDEQSYITSYIRYIIRAAIASSPTTTPVKASEERDLSLAVYWDAGKNKEFDYGIGRAEEDEDEAMEVLDLPDINEHLPDLQ